MNGISQGKRAHIDKADRSNDKANVPVEPMSSTSPKSTEPNRAKALECAKAAIDKKAENVKLLDLTQVESFTDYFVVGSALSDRQVRAIADSVSDRMEKQGYSLLSMEGYQEGRWVLMDYGDVIIHIFLDALRDYYDLENLWSKATSIKIPSEYYGSAASRLN